MTDPHFYCQGQNEPGYPMTDRVDLSDEGLRKAVEDHYGGPSEWVGSFAPDTLRLVISVRDAARAQALEEAALRAESSIEPGDAIRSLLAEKSGG